MDTPQEEGHIQGFLHEEIDAAFDGEVRLVWPRGNRDNGDAPGSTPNGFTSEPAVICGRFHVQDHEIGLSDLELGHGL